MCYHSVGCGTTSSIMQSATRCTTADQPMPLFAFMLRSHPRGAISLILGSATDPRVSSIIDSEQRSEFSSGLCSSQNPPVSLNSVDTKSKDQQLELGTPAPGRLQSLHPEKPQKSSR